MKIKKIIMAFLLGIAIVLQAACGTEEQVTESADVPENSNMAALYNFWQLDFQDDSIIKEAYFMISGERADIEFYLTISPEGSLMNTGQYKNDNGFTTHFKTYKKVDYKVVENHFFWDGDTGGGRGHLRYVYWMIDDIEYFLHMSTKNDNSAGIGMAVDPLVKFVIDNQHDLLRLNLSEAGYTKTDESWLCRFWRKLESGNAVTDFSYEVRPSEFLQMYEGYKKAADNFYTYEDINGSRTTRYIWLVAGDYALNAKSTAYDNQTDEQILKALDWVSPDSLEELILQIGIQD